MNKLHILLVEDEPALRRGLQILLGRFSDVEVVGEAETVADARTILAQTPVDLILLDVRLPDGTGFDLLDALGESAPHVIFVTAYDEHAIRALRADAVDYLLKPVDPDELRVALDRARAATMGAPDERRIVVQVHQERIVIPCANILRCEADGGYTHIVRLSAENVLSARPLKHYEEALAPDDFLRIHQSHLVNMDHVARYAHGYVVMNGSDRQLPVAIRRRRTVRLALDRHLERQR